MKWLRLYSSVLHDPKVQRLPPALFKYWVNLLCLANEQEPRGTLPSLEDISFALRVSEDEAETAITTLVTVGLLDDAEGLRPRGWRRHEPSFRAPLPPATKQFILERDGYTCQYCGAFGEPMEIDHIQPYSRGGTHDPNNLTTACHSCNQAKRDRTPEEWRA